MIGQDIVHSGSHGKVKTPKHMALAMAVRHLTGSKQIIKILNRMGHCASYDTVEMIDTALAREILAKTEEEGVAKPSNIAPGGFIQFAADNNDIHEETLDGKQTTHATTLVVYQKGHFGAAPLQRVYADHSQRKRSLTSEIIGPNIADFGAFGKRPDIPNIVNLANRKWFRADDKILSGPNSIDLAWALVRLFPVTLYKVETDIDVSSEQTVPSWSGFNTLFTPCATVTTSIGYCLMINGPSTDYSTVYTVMKTVQKMVDRIGQSDCVITFDLAIYMKAKEIQWRLDEEFRDTVIRMGGFHIILNFLAVIGKMYDNSGLEDLLIESGVYASGTASQLLKGKQYNRGIRAHKLVSEAFFRLQWSEFLSWMSKSNQAPANGELIEAKIDTLMKAITLEDAIAEPLEELTEAMTPLVEQFDEFKAEGRKASYMFAFWDEYLEMVSLMHSFIRAERSGDWSLHLNATAGMMPYFCAMDRMNYSRWLPIYLADMNSLPEMHPVVFEEFMNGNHAVSRSKQAFAQVWTDMALEQSVNLDSKRKGGIIGISRKPGALERWFLTSHERTAITTALKQMCDLDDSESQTLHKDCSSGRIKRDEEDVIKLMDPFTSEFMANPFVFEVQSDTDDKPIDLSNFATGVLAPQKVTDRLITAKKIGQDHIDVFIKERLETREKRFWDPFKQLKIATFASLSKTSTARTAEEKAVSISADRDLFGRLIIAAKSRAIDLKEVFSYELSSVPFALSHKDGSLRKSEKSVLMSILEERVHVYPQLPSEGDVPTAVMIDGMAFIQKLRSGGAVNFGDLCMWYYRQLVNAFRRCTRIDVVFDTYRDISIKSGERERRGASSHSLEVTIHSPATPVPRQWQKYISSAKNKTNLCAFLVGAWCEIGKEELQEDQTLVIAGGFGDNEKVVLVRTGEAIEIAALYSDHEEADTRLLLHAKHAAPDFTRIVVQSPDTDVLVLCCSQFSLLGCDELWFHTGTRDKTRYIPVHSISVSIGSSLCKALPGFHALTGCDSTSSFYGIGKKKAWNVIEKSSEFQTALGRLGQTISLSKKRQEMYEKSFADFTPQLRKLGQL